MAVPSGLDLSGVSDPRFVAAHQALVNDNAVQFDLQKAPPPPQPPQWLSTLGHWVEDILKPIGRFFEWLTSFMPNAPVARVLLWLVIIAIVSAALWLIINRLRGKPLWSKRARAQHDEPGVANESDWVPDRNAAFDWLAEADQLATNGAFAEAIHHLLYRGIEDIEHRRPELVRPASTSRNLAAASAIPSEARAGFGQIVALVECSLFAAKSVNEADWVTARDAYHDFAIARAWQV